jgi:hypothetical protein
MRIKTSMLKWGVLNETLKYPHTYPTKQGDKKSTTLQFVSLSNSLEETHLLRGVTTS